MKKKWFIAILILAVIAVVLAIVFINLFREKDTKQLAQDVHQSVEKGYLSKDSDEFTVIDSYLKDISSKLTTEAEKSEVRNYLDGYNAYVMVGEFFDRQIVFTQFTEVYKNNRKKVSDNLSHAQDKADALKDYINANKDLTHGSDYWQANTWVNCKQDMKDLMNYTIQAFNLLGDIYQASVPSKLMNNGLTDVIFDEIERNSKQILENASESDLYGSKLSSFANIYLTKSGEQVILNYQYSTVAKGKVEDIKKNGTESSYYSDLLTGRIAG